jgi:formylglycine-generating enzyme required for sulfatase activity
MDPSPIENAPRLFKGGVDVTPPSAPWPLVAVDRLVLLDLPPDAKKEARVLLTGACLGTSAQLGDEAESCVADEKTLASVAPLHLDDARDTSPTRAGTWQAEPCPLQAPDAPRVCVPGGTTVLGTPDLLSSIEEPALPVRTFALHRYFMDRFEATVGRFRDARAHGFAPPVAPVANDGPLSTTGNGVCTWSTTPEGREDYALNCVSWATARAFCKYTGGDLPSEAEWEHAATIAGRARKTRYPWGDDDPSCDQAAFGRADSAANHGKCLDRSPLPPPPSDSKNDTTPLGIVGLGAALSEWVIDKAVAYADACWVEGPLVAPGCEPGAVDLKSTIRGANYILPQMVASTIRFVDDRTTRTYPLGFRCVYAEDGP